MSSPGPKDDADVVAVNETSNTAAMTTTTTLTTTDVSPTTSANDHRQENDTDDSSNNNSNIGISKEELIDLIRAIKFAKPDLSQREVYNEITQSIPEQFPQFASIIWKNGGSNNDNNEENEAYIQLNDIKKVWKKALQQQQQEKQLKSISNREESFNNNADLIQRLQEMNCTPQLYTIGVGSTNIMNNTSSSSSSIVAKQYIIQHLQKQAQEEETKQKLEIDSIANDYVHIFLNIPCDRSGLKPNQALISFQNNGNHKKKITSSPGSNKKKSKKQATGGNTSKRKTKNTSVVPSVNAPFDDAIIVKIQMAASLENDENDENNGQGQQQQQYHPMLVYDETRKYQTFLHPKSLQEQDGSSTVDDGYIKIAQWIHTSGMDGILGQRGGTKAYFFSRLTQTSLSSSSSSDSGSNNDDILSIYIKELAPPQSW